MPRLKTLTYFGISPGSSSRRARKPRQGVCKMQLCRQPCVHHLERPDVGTLSGAGVERGVGKARHGAQLIAELNLRFRS